ncbi:MAG: glycosyltransferase family 2 protein [Oligoflexus sp.]
MSEENLIPHIQIKDSAIKICRLDKYGLEVEFKKPGKPGWYRLELKALNPLALAWFETSKPIAIHQNGSPFAVQILPSSTNRQNLVFYRHQNLVRIHLKWQQKSLSRGDIKLAFHLCSIHHLHAWCHMFRCVARRDQVQTGDWQRVYRKSWARFRKKGWQHTLKKLMQEYHPLFNHQIVGCDPYTYWQKNLEKNDAPNSLPSFIRSQKFHVVIAIGRGFLAQDLKGTLTSIQKQSYNNWQITIITACQEQIRQIQAISTCQISFLSEMTVTRFDPKAYYLWMKPGDELSLRAFAECVKFLEQSATQKVLYCDHDILDEKGQRTEPNFKPNWNPDLLTAQNYLGPSVWIQGDILCLDAYVRGSYFRIIKATYELYSTGCEEPLPIARLPQVLYHQSHKNKDDLSILRDLAVIRHLQTSIAHIQKNRLIRINFDHKTRVFRPVYQIPDLPLVSLIIPTRDALEITKTCVESILRRTTYPNYEILIINNQSQENPTLRWFQQLKEHPRIRVFDYDHPFNYSAINNFGAQKARGQLIGLINNDTKVINRGWLTEMVRHACRPNIGCVGAKLYYFDDTIQHGGVILGLWGLAGHSHKNYIRGDAGYQKRLISIQNYSAVTAACLVMRKDLFLQVGGLNEEKLHVAFNDVDLCLKVTQLGYRNLWTPYAELYHYESKSRGKDFSLEQKARERREIEFMRQSWKEIIADDPSYNPNLTKTREDFSIGIEV